jgi:hypothetical protein
MARIALPFPHPKAPASRPVGSPPHPTEERPIFSRLALGWVGVGLLFAGGLLSLYLVQVSSVAMAGYNLERLEEERQLWLSRNQQLEVELAKRRSLAWTEADAVQRLGMARVEAPVFLVVPAPGNENDGEVQDARGRGTKPAKDRAIRQPAAIEVLRVWFDELLSRRR